MSWNDGGTKKFTLYLNDTYYAQVIWIPTELTWYHIAMVYDAPNHTVKYFVDGTQQGTDQNITTTSINNTTAEFSIGSSGNPINGLVDEARVSNSIRYTTTFSVQTEEFGTDANTMALWHFNDALTDASGNGNDLTDINTATYSTDIPFVGTTPAVIREEYIISFE
jgi:hypothetical protein